MRLKHTDQEYEGELRTLRDQLLLMGTKVEQIIAGSVKALVDRDSELAGRLVQSDTEIDRLEVETDDLCLRILARRQPVASDLRFITIAMKMVTDLERMGDLGVSICERVIELNTEPPLRPYLDLPRMAEAVQVMVHEALDAFVKRDADQAEQVLKLDQTVDVYYGQIFRELLTWMMEDGRNIYRATRVQSIAKYLERVGDHATNLAEMVVFMVKGQDIRHLGRIDAPSESALPKGLLFVCVQNAARSQMAEGLARKLLPASVHVWSAGSKPGGAVHPLAIQVMQEVGVDLSGARPKPVADVPLAQVDTVITLCAEEECPVLPGKMSRREAWPLPDPAKAGGTEAEQLAAFRKVCDELSARVQTLKPR
jgi:phosphate transport system protein